MCLALYRSKGRVSAASVAHHHTEVLASIASAHSLSLTQTVLLWHKQRGVAAIPRSKNPDHIRDNFLMLSTDECLTDAEMKRIAELDKGERLTSDWVGVFEETAWPWPWVGTCLGWVSQLIWFLIPFRVDLKMPASGPPASRRRVRGAR